MKFRRIGEKPPQYDFVDALCIGRKCWHPDLHKGRPCCMNRANRGCPSGPVGERKGICEMCQASGLDKEPCDWCGNTGKTTIGGLPEYDKALADKRKAEGWRRA